MIAIAKIIVDNSDIKPEYGVDVQGSDNHCIIPSNLDGTPKYNWALVRLETPSTATGENLFKIPMPTLTTTVGDIPQAKRQAIKQKMQAKGISTAWITLDHTLRDIIIKIGKYLDVNFKSLKESYGNN